MKSRNHCKTEIWTRWTGELTKLTTLDRPTRGRCILYEERVPLYTCRAIVIQRTRVRPNRIELQCVDRGFGGFWFWHVYRLWQVGDQYRLGRQQWDSLRTDTVAKTGSLPSTKFIILLFMLRAQTRKCVRRHRLQRKYMIFTGTCQSRFSNGKTAIKTGNMISLILLLHFLCVCVCIFLLLLRYSWIIYCLTAVFSSFWFLNLPPRKAEAIAWTSRGLRKMGHAGQSVIVAAFRGNPRSGIGRQHIHMCSFMCLRKF